MRRAALIAVLVASGVPAATQATPRFALRAGASCSMCHVDPSGGGPRNAYGRGVYSQTELALLGSTLPEGAAPLDATIGESVALGSDLRVLYQHLHRADADQPRMDSFYLMEAGLYLTAELWERLTLIVAPYLHGSESFFFEASALVRLGLGDSYLKAGRFMPAYGTKLPNHTVFIRKQLGFGITSREVGLELGLDFGPVLLQVGAFNGIPGHLDSDWDENTAKGVAARLEVHVSTRPVKLLLGLSGLYNLGGNAAEDDPSGQDSRVEDLRVGGFAGLSVGRFAWLGEVDIQRVDDRAEEAAVMQLVSWQELAFLAIRGLDIVASYELWDPNVELDGDALHRVGGGLDVFPWPFAEVSLRYRYTLGDARQPFASVHEVMAIAHVFF